MMPPVRTRTHWLLPLVLLLGLLGAACGVDFEPDDFCYRCSRDEDCGEGFVCEHDGPTGFCVPSDPTERAKSPCNPPG